MHPVTIAGTLSPWEPAVFSLVIYGMMILALVTALLFIASWLGEKKTNPEKLRPYESGIIPTGSARLRYPVPFFLIAVFFLIFDVEGAYIFSWGHLLQRTWLVGVVANIVFHHYAAFRPRLHLAKRGT